MISFWKIDMNMKIGLTTTFEQSFLQKSGHDYDGDDVGIAQIKYYDVEPGKDFERW